MKDIDFDELDRAVSSVLGQSGQTSGDRTPAPSSSADDVRAVGTAGPRKNLVQKRRSGRFMDVVPPASRTKQRAAAQPAVSRQGVQVSPAEVRDVAPADSTQASAQKESAPAVTEPAIEAVALAQNESTDQGVKDSVADDRHDADVALDEAAGELAELHGLMHEADEAVPLDTPFKSDMTLEKRPLGAFSLGDTDGTLLTDEAKRQQGESESDAEDEAGAAFDMDMSHALRKELEAHESQLRGETPLKADEPKAQAGEKAVATVKASLTGDEDDIPEDIQDKMTDIAALPVGESQSPTPKKTPQVAGGGSIQPQYKAKGTPQSEEITPVFETDTYHQPLLHEKKKKSGWLSVVFITLLVVLGIGLGAVVYFLDPFGLL